MNFKFDSLFVEVIHPLLDMDNNSDFWNRLEIFSRDLTKSFSNVWIISGPLWIPQESPMKMKLNESGDSRRKKNKVLQHEVIGDREVFVPTHLYKLILAEDVKNGGKPQMAAFVVPNEPIDKIKRLIDFKIPVEELERKLGYKFFYRLDRAKVLDLCQANGCEMMNYRKFQGYFITRAIEGAKNENELEKYWKKAKEMELVDPKLSDLYDRKLKELKSKPQGQELKSNKKSPVVAGG